MSSLRFLIRGLLQEGPVDKMKNAGVPPVIAEYLYDALPPECADHAAWFMKQLIDSMHQFKDYFLKYKVNIKKFKKTKDKIAKSVADASIEELESVIDDKMEDIELICQWSSKTKTNLSKSKNIVISVNQGRGKASKMEKVPLTLSSAVQAARDFFEMSDGTVVLELSNGWYWLDRETSSCSIEAEKMGHCGQAGESGPFRGQSQCNCR